MKPSAVNNDGDSALLTPAQKWKDWEVLKCSTHPSWRQDGLSLLTPMSGSGDSSRPWLFPFSSEEVLTLCVYMSMIATSTQYQGWLYPYSIWKTTCFVAEVWAWIATLCGASCLCAGQNSGGDASVFLEDSRIGSGDVLLPTEARLDNYDTFIILSKEIL